MATKKAKLDIFGTRDGYRPFHFPKYFEMYKAHRAADWTPEEAPLNDDIYQWQKVLDEGEKNFLTHIFRFFTQADVDVAGAYATHYLPRFKHPEIRMMMLDFAAREAVHIDAYSGLVDQLGMPETTYQAFLEYEAMAEKHDYISKFGGDTIEDLIKQMFVFSVFTEGMALFSSFVMLLNFQRFGKMPGMCTRVEWSIRDENLHFNGMVELFKDVVRQNKEVWTDELKAELYDIAEKMIELEDKFIDLAFELGPREGLTVDEMKQYIRYIGNSRLHMAGLKNVLKWNGKVVRENPMPWVEEMLNLPIHTNFFEARVTEYSKGTLTGSWDNFWAKPVESN